MPLRRTSPWLCASLALALFVLAPLALAARPAPQTAPPAASPAAETFAESIDVDVVSVEVFVTDHSGRTIAGLSRGDFELKVDGRPVSIINFYAGAAGSPPAPAPAQATARAAAPAPAASALPAGGEGAAAAEDRRLNLIVFVDNTSLTPDGRFYALDSLSRFFRTGLHPDDNVLLASFDGLAVKVRRLSAGDPEAVVAAFRAVASVTARGSHAAEEEPQALRDLANAQSPPEISQALIRLDFLDMEMRAGTRSFLGILAELVDSVAGLPGRKALLYLSGDLRIETGDPRVKEVARRASARQITLYGLAALADPAGAGDPDGRMTRRLLARRDGLSQTLYEMTGPTGGLSGVDLLNPAAILARIHDDFGSYYSLGFAPIRPEGADDRKSHRLEVRVLGRRGLEVRFPATYTARTRDERLGERALTALTLQVADNPLGVRLAVAGERPGRDGKSAVTVSVELPLARLTLVPGQGAREGRMTLVATARDVRGRNLPLRRIAVPVRVPEDRLPAALSQTAAYRLVLELPPGAAILAVALRDDLGGGESIAVGDYTVGRPGAVKASVAHPSPPGAP